MAAAVGRVVGAVGDGVDKVSSAPVVCHKRGRRRGRKGVKHARLRIESRRRGEDERG